MEYLLPEETHGYRLIIMYRYHTLLFRETSFTYFIYVLKTLIFRGGGISRLFVWFFFCLFVYSNTSTVSVIWRSSRIPVIELHILDLYASHLRLLVIGVLLRATHVATWGLGLYGLEPTSPIGIRTWDI